MDVPQPIQLKQKDLDALRDLQQEGEAIQRFVETMVNQGKVKMQKVQQKGSAIYQGIAHDYGIDMKSVHWAPDFSRGLLVPVRMQLVEEPTE